MKRIVGAALFGLGVLLVILAIGLSWYVAPSVSQLPYDLERSTSVAEAPNAQFLQITAGEANVETGKLRSTVEVIPQAKVTHEKMTGSLKGEAVVWDVYQTVVRAGTDEVINAYSTELAIDRRSGAAAKWNEAWLEDGTELKPNYSGQIYKFPFGTEKKDYKVYDRDLRRTFPAKFKEVTTVRGVEVYRFEQVIPEQPLRIDDNSLAVLLGRFAPEATSGEVMYRNTRTFWVEPVTGAYVDLRDQPHKELVPDVGSGTVLLQADFRYTDETAVASAKKAQENARTITLLGVWAPIGLGVLGLIGLVLGAFLVFSDGGPAARNRQFAGAAQPIGPSAGAADADGPLTDVLPPASTNWAVPDQRASTDRPTPH